MSSKVQVIKSTGMSRSDQDKPITGQDSVKSGHVKVRPE